MNYYISDLHIGHANVIRFDKRPFADLNEMHRAIIDNWNSRVKTDDTVYILGDFIWQKENLIFKYFFSFINILLTTRYLKCTM